MNTDHVAWRKAYWLTGNQQEVEQLASQAETKVNWAVMTAEENASVRTEYVESKALKLWAAYSCYANIQFNIQIVPVLDSSCKFAHYCYTC